MRVLTFTDIHGSMSILKTLKKKAKNVDLILCMGDFTVFEMDMERVLKKINALGKDVLLIHGNHEYSNEVARLCKKHKRITFLHKKTKVIGNCLFMGYGGGGFALKDKEFEKFGVALSKEMKKHKDKKSILMLHGPPYGTKLDELYAGAHCGNKSYTRFIKKSKPDFVFAGHIHECFGHVEKIGKSVLRNPAPDGRIIRM
jgi:uncharacterized protein